MHCKSLFIPLILLALIPSANAERRDITVQDLSTSGRTLRLNAGSRDGLHLKEAFLVRDGENKLVAARVIQLSDGNAIGYVVEHYDENRRFQKGDSLNILYGIPLGNIPDLPDNLADTVAPNNPQDERFFSADGREVDSADLDDDNYEPETDLKPRLPEKKLASTHNLTLGVGLYRNANLSQTTLMSGSKQAKSLYQGLAFRYQYNYKTSYWSRRKMPIWIGVELGSGVYNFTQSYPSGGAARIQVFPLSVNVKYIWELNKFLRGYPYLGYQNNLVSATAQSNTPISDLRGSSIIIGAGLGMLLSDTMDARVDVGTDGALLAAVVKF